MKVQIVNRRLPMGDETPLYGDNIFGEIHDNTAPRAIIPRRKLTAPAEVCRPDTFKSHAPERVQRTTPNTMRGVSCMFASGQVMTTAGAKVIGELKVGDMVLTRDNGFQPVRWTGQISAGDAIPQMIEIQSGAIDIGIPTESLIVSGRQKVLLSSPEITQKFGTREVFARAVDLLHIEGVNTFEGTADFVGVMFGRHEVLRVNNAWMESLLPDAETMSHLDEAAKAEINAALPNLKDLPIERSFPIARPLLKSDFARQFSRENIS